ncbi:MAG: hypothetical protein PHN80_13755 [Hespellia sp.]|nr:hypothetical protein [Hespellia sp.]
MNQTLEAMESSLNQLLSILKKNKEAVAPDLLQTIYRDSYEELKNTIKHEAEAYVKAVTLPGLKLNVNISWEEQICIINQAIQDSGMMKEISRCFFRYYDLKKAYQLCLQLCQRINEALYANKNMDSAIQTPMSNHIILQPPKGETPNGQYMLR